MGVFGGMFDPPHRGHVALARAGVEHFALDRLLVRVVADPGHRTVETPAELRLQLADVAFADIPGAEVALDPCARTVDSLESLGLDDPVFLVGADEFVSFPAWKDPQRVLELARLGVATRPGYPTRAYRRCVARALDAGSSRPVRDRASRGFILGDPPPRGRR